MRCEILMIGSELLLGQILDTNAGMMARHLAEHGINLYQKTTVGDNPGRIEGALRDALSRSDVVLCSGGLGPTEDDITRECVAAVFGRPMEYRPELYEVLAARFAHLRVPLTENNKKQAQAPRGAVSLPNPHGTAPGILVEDDSLGAVICMPGVPWELEPMLVEHAIPYICRRYGIHATIRSRVLKVCGIGESRVDAAIGDLINNQVNPTVGVLASPDSVRIRMTARAESAEEAEAMLDALEPVVRDRLPGLVMGINDETLEGVVGGLLRARGWKAAFAETVTGGMLAHRFSAVAGDAFAGAAILPGADGPAEDLAAAAAGMAEQVCAQFNAGCALAIAASVRDRAAAIAWRQPGACETWSSPCWGTDEKSRIRLATAALEQVRRHLMG